MSQNQRRPSAQATLRRRPMSLSVCSSMLSKIHRSHRTSWAGPERRQRAGCRRRRAGPGPRADSSRF
jgi:hypothetical protein